MRRMMVWAAAATMALAGAAFAQNGPATQQRTGDRARIHQPAEGQGQAQMAKKQQKQVNKAAKRAAKAERKANKTAMARAKKGPENGTGNMGSGPRDGAGYGVNSGRRSGPMDGTGPQATGGQARGQGSARGGRDR